MLLWFKVNPSEFAKKKKLLKWIKANESWTELSLAEHFKIILSHQVFKNALFVWELYRKY